MIILESIELKHKAPTDAFRDKEGLYNGDYCFGNLFGWGEVFNTKVSFYNGMYASVAEIGGNRLLISYPLGEGDISAYLSELLKIAEQMGKTPVLGLLNKKLAEKAQKIEGHKIEVIRMRDSDDYIYKTESLINLSGKELHAKKNMLNSFLKNDYIYQKITEDILPQVAEFCLERAFTEKEKSVIKRMCSNFEALKLDGGVLKIGGEIVAATVAERRGDTVIIHIEKARKNVRGAYAAINNLYLKNNAADTLFVNREDDMGIENLRKAKLSYKPYKMEEKYLGIFK